MFYQNGNVMFEKGAVRRRKVQYGFIRNSLFLCSVLLTLTLTWRITLKSQSDVGNVDDNVIRSFHNVYGHRR